MNNEYNTNLLGMIQSTDDAIVIQSLDGTIQSWNMGSEKMFGYTSNEMIGKNISVIIPPEFINDNKNQLSRKANNEIADRYETTRIKKNGEQLYVSVMGSYIKDSAGNITGSYQVARDITSQKKNEAKLIEAINELAFQNYEKEKRANELIIANEELAFQNQEKEKRVAKLIIANKELAFQNDEKEKRANELIVANEELAFQNQEKEKRAAELLIACKELDFLHVEKHSLFASIVNSSDDAMLSKTIDGVIISWNYGAEKIFGYSPDEIIGKNVLILVPPELQQEVADIIKKIKNGETIKQYETRRVRKDGTTFHASLTISPIRNFEGNIIGASKVLRDITEKKELENLLKKSNELARIGGWEVDLQNNTVFWSDITKEIHEVAPDYIPITETGFTFYKKESSRDKIIEYVEQAIHAGKSWDYEFPIVTAKGNDRWIRVIGEAEIVDGNCVRIYGSFQDIDERKKAEIKLIENENYLRTILDNEPECVEILNRKGELVSMNPAGLAMIEADNEQQVLGHRMTDLVNKEFQIGFNQLSAAVFKGNSGTFEFEITGLKGGCRWLETHAVPLKDSSGIIVNLLGVTRDITERKKTEQHLKLLESVITNTKDSVLITEAEPFDEPGPRILYVNDAFTKMTGYSSEEVIGKTPRILQGPKSDKAELKRLSEAIRRWESCEITIINYKKNGEEFWVNFSVSPVANKLGWHTHWIAIERDVTDLKKHISAIENQNIKLREIAWSQSHIVRAPLTRMMGIASMLKDIKPDSSEYNEWVAYFNDSASELDKIIKDIVSKAQTILLN